MALKVELKPGERIILGDCVVTNDDQRTRLLIEGHVPILREKDILTVERADTPAKRLYHCVQMMYLKNDVPRFQATYLGFLKEVQDSCAGSAEAIAVINHHVSTGALYKALKEIRKLMKGDAERSAA